MAPSAPSRLRMTALVWSTAAIASRRRMMTASAATPTRRVSTADASAMAIFWRTVIRGGKANWGLVVGDWRHRSSWRGPIPGERVKGRDKSRSLVAPLLGMTTTNHHHQPPRAVFPHHHPMDYFVGGLSSTPGGVT